MTDTTSRTDAVSDALRDTTVLDVEGESVRLGSLWRDQPAVLVFVRHYG